QYLPEARGRGNRVTRAAAFGATMGGLKEAGMADTKTAVANKPVWVDLSSDDAAASREFYAKLFGWKVEVNPDPQYGGYAMADVFPSGAPNTFAWAELNARGIEKGIPFYAATFGWTAKKSEMGEGAPPYTEFQLGGESIAGGTEMNPMVPAQVPSHWLVYFGV